MEKAPLIADLVEGADFDDPLLCTCTQPDEHWHRAVAAAQIVKREGNASESAPTPADA